MSSEPNARKTGSRELDELTESWNETPASSSSREIQTPAPVRRDLADAKPARPPEQKLSARDLLSSIEGLATLIRDFVTRVEGKIDNLESQVKELNLKRKQDVATLGDVKSDLSSVEKDLKETYGRQLSQLAGKYNEALGRDGILQKTKESVNSTAKQLKEELTGRTDSVQSAVDQLANVVGQLQESAANHGNTVRGLSVMCKAWQTSLNEIRDAAKRDVENLAADVRARLTSLTEERSSELGKDNQRRFEELRQFHQTLLEARDSLILAHGKTQEEFRREFADLRKSYESVQAADEYARSPEGILRLLQAYQTAVAEDLDVNARAVLLERLPALLRAVETELAPWQLMQAGENEDSIEVTRDGQVLPAGAVAAGQSEKASPAEVELVTKVVVRTLETIQERVVKWLKECGLERIPNPGEQYDGSLHHARKFLPTDRRQDDHKIKRVLYSGIRRPGDDKMILQSLVDVWEYRKPVRPLE